MANQQQLREKITAQIIAALESGGTPPWRRPWRVGPNAGASANVVSKKSYRGINVLLLEAASARLGLNSKWWATFNQWKGLGGKVMKRPPHVPEGQYGTTVVFWSPITKTVRDETGKDEEDRFFIMKSFTIFNVDQVEGDHLDHLRVGPADTDGDDAPSIDYRPAEEAIEAAIDGMGVGLRYGGGRAYYSPVQDFIQLPPRATFDGPEEFYATIFHEFVHATEHPNRLNWCRKDRDNTYALGELVAELGSCFIARELGVPASEDMSNHVAYIANWLKAMKDDPRFIFTASSQASRAADFILSYSRPQVAEEVESEAVLAG